MSATIKPPKPEHVLEMLYHRELGWSLGDGENSGWIFRSAFEALGYHPSPAELSKYRDYFIEHGFGKFDGKDDPDFRISSHGEHVARISIARRRPWYSWHRLETYNWTLWGVIFSIALGLAALIKA